MSSEATAAQAAQPEVVEATDSTAAAPGEDSTVANDSKTSDAAAASANVEHTTSKTEEGGSNVAEGKAEEKPTSNVTSDALALLQPEEPSLASLARAQVSQPMITSPLAILPRLHFAGGVLPQRQQSALG